MKMLDEFKSFAVRGNVVDMAVGIIIGAAFGKIVSSLVADVVTPPLGLLIGGVDFSSLSIKLSSPIGNMAPVVLSYGKFIQACFDFCIVALAVFLLVKAVNRLKRKEEEHPSTPPTPSPTETLLTEIRDLLRQQQR